MSREITELLLAWRDGDEAALETLVVLNWTEELKARVQGPETYASARFLIRARRCAVNAAMTWHTQPKSPPVPIHIPGVTISQKIPRRKSPL